MPRLGARLLPHARPDHVLHRRPRWRPAPGRVREGASALEAAGKIHSDIARGFIRAEVIRWDDLVACRLAHRGAEARRAARRGQRLRRRGRRRAQHPLQRLIRARR